MAVRGFRNTALVGYLILALGVGVVFSENHHESVVRRQQGTEQRAAIVRSGTAIAVAGCNRDFQTITALRQVLTDAQRFVEVQHNQHLIGDSQFQRSEAFYNTQLGRVKRPDCRKAANVITSNPDRHTIVPKPLHK